MKNLECDFSFEIPNLARFRVNAFNQHRGAGAVFRTIPSKVLTLEELNCPKIFKDISEYPRGIVLVPGRPVRASRRRWRPWSTTSTKTITATS
jgi:twitching motility protein PilT